MIWLRSALFNVLFFSWTATMIVGMLGLMPLPRRFMQGAVRLWGIGIRFLLRALIGLDHEVRGVQYMPKGAAVIASKHQSAWDTTIFHGLLPDPIYVMKKELSRIPFWGWYVRKAGSISIDRAGGGGALKGMIRHAKAALAAGRQVVVFPQGTRTAPGQHRQYLPGVYAVYAAGNAPAVPVAVNSGLFWGRHQFLKRPGTITIEFLEPIPPGLDKETFMALLESRTEAATDRLVAEARDRFPALRKG